MMAAMRDMQARLHVTIDGIRQHRRGAYPYERDVFHFRPIL